ncbi:hypothetical protein LIER_34673 [Lithospermum erythrorhizon]|uniref:Aminotransferase-like plant mobile domain-containing protein n=1 Tax=Lithospermum erythrorhizon TaxID=34254 RepID=A0AAV3S355_LITER
MVTFETYLGSEFSTLRKAWTEDVLSRCSDILDSAPLFDAVKASLCVYDYSEAFLKAFCENWYPSTNTLIIHQGDLSISLWDLSKIGGLPVIGHLFDKVVPTAKCLSPTLDGDARIPRSYRLLLLAYHCLASHSPNGTFSHRSWDSGDRYPFDILEVDTNLEEEVYCAAFLSCWLCVFVLPIEPLSFIRANVFKMASIMAKGSRVILAPLVLSIIYRSLSQISLSDNLSTAQECFPTHYLFGWIGAYLYAKNTDTNSPYGPLMVRYHGKVKEKVYSPSDTRSTLHSCQLNKLFLSEDSHHSHRKHGKRKSILVGMHSSTLVFMSSGSSKRKRSSDSAAEDSNPKHTRGTRKETSSSCGSRVLPLVRSSLERAPVPTSTPSVIPDNVVREQVVEVSSSSNEHEHIELIDTEESPEYYYRGG